MKQLILIFLILFANAVFSQRAETFKIKKFKVAKLSDSIRETSGLDFFGERLFTFNDSENPPELYEIDKNSGKILKTFKTDFTNRDWEALANDGENFYIGDFGNNAGTRKDLKIYKIPFDNDSLKPDSAKTIPFRYPEQTDFSSKNTNTDFDAEAMIFLDGKLHIFTKEWHSKKVSHYIVNPDSEAISENQAAEKSETFDLGFVATDAAYFDKKLYLIGYTKKAKVFLSIFSETQPGIFFQETPKKYCLGSAFSIGQIEGIAANETGIYISAETFISPIGTTKPRLYKIPNFK
ncbi:MAG: hypothetical protein LBE36_05540 [Flavobacteriaceae bacterium]|jgi:hypothetical protein|nr:hypothetical protein [Flavobacteriaceae bacterium]